MDSNSSPDFRMRGLTNLQLYQNLINPFGFQMPNVNPMQAAAAMQQQILTNQFNEFQKNMTNNLANLDPNSANAQNAQKLLKQSFVEYNKKLQATTQYIQQQQQQQHQHPHPHPIVHQGFRNLHHQPSDEETANAAAAAAAQAAQQFVNYNKMLQSQSSKHQKSFVTNNQNFEATAHQGANNIIFRQSLVVQQQQQQQLSRSSATPNDQANTGDGDHRTTDDSFDQVKLINTEVASLPRSNSTSSLEIGDEHVADETNTDILDDESEVYNKSYSDSISISSDYENKTPISVTPASVAIANPGQKYDFTLNALDLSLYGYIRQIGMKTLGHAITDLKYLHDFINVRQQAVTPNSDVAEQVTDKKAKCSDTTKKTSHFSIDNLLTPCAMNETSQSSTEIEMIRNYIPDDIEIRQAFLSDTVHYGMFCKKTVIPKGTKYGPFPGKSVSPNDVHPSEDDYNMWEVFVDGRLSHFIDQGKTNQKTINQNSEQNYWMIYINCARFAQEQNLIAVQTHGEIYYEVCKDIGQGQELLVWYGDSYLQFLGIPVSLKEMNDEMDEDTSENKDGFKCDRCGKVFAYKYYRDKHLKYTRCVDQGDRKFPCHLCTRSFEKRDRLRIHILHVHEKHRPHKCTVCAKSFSQSSSLNKHMRVHSGERPYKCIYCNKAFTASSILRTHIRQHSGEKPFKCKYCGKAFASHAAHDSHVRRTHCITKDMEALM